MRASYSRLYIHLIWATWDRQDLIDDELEKILYTYIAKKCVQLNVILLKIGGTPNHILLLVKLLPATTISTFVKNIKGSSAHYIAQIVRPDEFFKWQGGYGVISVSPIHLSTISTYIASQKEHQQNGSFNTYWDYSK